MIMEISQASKNALKENLRKVLVDWRATLQDIPPKECDAVIEDVVGWSESVVREVLES